MESHVQQFTIEADETRRAFLRVTPDAREVLFLAGYFRARFRDMAAVKEVVQTCARMGYICHVRGPNEFGHLVTARAFCSTHWHRE